MSSERPSNERTDQQKAVAAAFGDIVSILMRTEGFKEKSLSDLDWLVMPAIRNGQFALAHGDPAGQQSTQRPAVPIAAVLWATVSTSVDGRLRGEVADTIELDPTEWASGDIPWIVAAAGTQDALKALLRRLAEVVFKDQPANMVVMIDGALEIKQITVN